VAFGHCDDARLGQAARELREELARQLEALVLSEDATARPARGLALLRPSPEKVRQAIRSAVREFANLQYAKAESMLRALLPEIDRLPPGAERWNLASSVRSQLAQVVYFAARKDEAATIILGLLREGCGLIHSPPRPHCARRSSKCAIRPCGALGSFYGGQSASIAATASAGGWVIAETATDERIVLANASSLQAQLWMRNPDKSVWEQDPGFSGIGVQVASMHQAGFIGLPCSSTTTCVSDLHVWHVSGGDIGAKPSPLGKVTAAGVGPLPHPATGSTMFAPIYVGWSEHPAGSNVPKLVVTVACQDTLPTPGTWLRSAPLVSLSSAATEVAGLDFGQGVSKVAIAVDSVSSVAGQDVHSSQFGLLPGDACGNSIAVDWSSGGGLVQGRNPTTAFSNDGVLWRALAREKDLWVLAPLKTR
jgi:hypothetical protein